MQSTVIQIMTGYEYNFKLKVIIIIFYKVFHKMFNVICILH